MVEKFPDGIEKSSEEFTSSELYKAGVQEKNQKKEIGVKEIRIRDKILIEAVV